MMDAVTLSIAAAATAFSLAVVSLLAKNKNKRLKDLRHTAEHLKEVTSLLLANANQLDERAAYAKPAEAEALHGEIRRICEGLVILADALNVIENELRNGNVGEARELIKKCSNSAQKLANRLAALKHILETHSL